jgi:hypothetical protein
LNEKTNQETQTPAKNQVARGVAKHFPKQKKRFLERKNTARKRSLAAIMKWLTDYWGYFPGFSSPPLTLQVIGTGWWAGVDKSLRAVETRSE